MDKNDLRNLSVAELMQKLVKIKGKKSTAIQQGLYEYAARLRDEERKIIEEIDSRKEVNQPKFRNVHFVGLGDAGCGILKQINWAYPYLKYTMVTELMPSDLQEGIQFVSFANLFCVGTRLEQQENYLRKELLDRLEIGEEAVLLFGCGGGTGTILADQLISYFEERHFRYLAASSWPLPFDGPIRQNLAEEFRQKHHNNKQVFIAKEECESLFSKPDKRQLSLDNFFKEIDAMLIGTVYSMLGSTLNE